MAGNVHEQLSDGTWAVRSVGVGATTDSGAPAGLMVLGDLISGERQTEDVLAVENQNGYELIAAGAGPVVPGAGSGAVGDYLADIQITTNGGALTIFDGAVSYAVIDTTAWKIGDYIPVRKLAKTAWKITTAAGTTCACGGRFS